MTQLYRHFADDGTLLYVGIATDGAQRLRQHRSTSAWGPLIARVETVEYPDKQRALAAETWAIGTEQPVFNQRKLGDVTMSNAEVGAAISFTLEEAYTLARKGDVFHTIDPVEFASMGRMERRHHRRLLNRLARQFLSTQK